MYDEVIALAVDKTAVSFQKLINHFARISETRRKGLIPLMRVFYLLILFSCSDVAVPTTVTTTRAPITAPGMENFVNAQNYKERFGNLEIVYFQNNSWKENEQETAGEKLVV